MAPAGAVVVKQAAKEKKAGELWRAISTLAMYISGIANVQRSEISTFLRPVGGS